MHSSWSHGGGNRGGQHLLADRPGSFLQGSERVVPAYHVQLQPALDDEIGAPPPAAGILSPKYRHGPGSFGREPCMTFQSSCADVTPSGSLHAANCRKDTARVLNHGPRSRTPNVHIGKTRHCSISRTDRGQEPDCYPSLSSMFHASLPPRALDSIQRHKLMTADLHQDCNGIIKPVQWECMLSWSHGVCWRLQCAGILGPQHE